MRDPVIMGDGAVVLYCGDCRDVLPTMEAESVHSIVTDPPYGLGFMGKGWDHGVPGVDFWTAALRVAKPGAHLLAFGGTRTFHRLAVAIEDAGWELRDTIGWLYGSGFPKSHDVSKAIDKAAGAERERVAGPKSGGMAAMNAGNAEKGYRGSGYYEDGNQMFSDEPATEAARKWSGWGTALKPAWEPIIVARKPFPGTVAANVLRHGTGAINVDECRVGLGEEKPFSYPSGPGGCKSGDFHYQDRATTPAQGNPAGRWPANLIHDGSDEVVGLFPQSIARPVKPENIGKSGDGTKRGLFGNGSVVQSGYYDTEGSAARFFYCAKASKRDRDEGCEGLEAKHVGHFAQDEWSRQNMGNTPDAERKPVRNFHPTVKPTALMRYLCRLVTPPGGKVLDMFCGSGSTGKGAVLEGFDFDGIDREAEYVEISKARIEYALQQRRLEL